MFTKQSHTRHTDIFEFGIALAAVEIKFMHQLESTYYIRVEQGPACDNPKRKSSRGNGESTKNMNEGVWGILQTPCWTPCCLFVRLSPPCSKTQLAIRTVLAIYGLFLRGRLKVLNYKALLTWNWSRKDNEKNLQKTQHSYPHFATGEGRVEELSEAAWRGSQTQTPLLMRLSRTTALQPPTGAGFLQCCGNLEQQKLKPSSHPHFSIRK